MGVVTIYDRLAVVKQEKEVLKVGQFCKLSLCSGYSKHWGKPHTPGVRHGCDWMGV